jgi:hypothetical protein
MDFNYKLIHKFGVLRKVMYGLTKNMIIFSIGTVTGH